MRKKPPKSGTFWDLFTADAKAKKGAKPNSSSFFGLFGSKDSGANSEPPPCAEVFNEDFVFWALRNLPIKEALKHFLVCGTSGSGKSIAIQLFLQSIAPRFRPGRKIPEQLIIFDGMCEVVPMLAALGFHPEDENVWLLNPYDARSAAWNLGEATRSPLLARQLAALLVPEEKNSTARYFSDGARELVYSVILALNQIRKSRWTFRDLLCALDSHEHIEKVTAHHRRAKRHAARILNDEKHAAGVLSTLATKLGHFEQVAALWHTNKSKHSLFTVEEFLKRPGVLILGNDPVLKDSLWPINAILLKALTQEILRGPKTLMPRYWFVLDEFRAMERVDCIHDLANRGRSKGASILLGIQSVEGLMEVYGENGANDILSLCAHKTFLRAGGPQTGEWAEKHFGKVRHHESVYSESWSHNQGSHSVQHNLQERSLLLASFFLNLPFPGLGRPYIAVSDVPSLDCTLISQRPFDEVFGWCKPAADIPNVVPRTSVEEQTLEPWSEGEESFFCGKSDKKKRSRVRSRKSDSGPQKTKVSKKDLPKRQNPAQS